MLSPGKGRSKSKDCNGIFSAPVSEVAIKRKQGCTAFYCPFIMILRSLRTLMKIVRTSEGASFKFSTTSQCPCSAARVSTPL